MVVDTFRTLYACVLSFVTGYCGFPVERLRRGNETSVTACATFVINTGTDIPGGGEGAYIQRYTVATRMIFALRRAAM